MKETVLENKSLVFSGEVVKVYRYLTASQNEQVLSKQLLRSGTSIGANIFEAGYAQSRNDFVSKLQIALKETAETEYWLKLLTNSGFIEEKESICLLSKCIEIKKMLIASINTTKAK